MTNCRETILSLNFIFIFIFIRLLSATNNNQQIIFFNSQSNTPSLLTDKTNHSRLDTNYIPDSTYLGWSSWSLQAFRGKGYGFYWLKEKHIKAQADIIADEFLQFGYDRINLDSGWQDPELDQYGRFMLNRLTFPHGIHHLQSYLAQRSLKLGLYFLPGIDTRAVNNKSPIMHTDYTADQIIQCPRSPHGRSQPGCRRPLANAFGAGYALNYSHPGSQMYINSLVDGLYAWNVSFVKLDALVPGSSFDVWGELRCDTTLDLAGWRRAIEERWEQEWQHVGRQKIWLVASWAIPTEQGPLMDKHADSWRVEQDIEAYSDLMTTFDRVIRNVKAAALWANVEENRGWRGLIDLDSLLVSDMSYEESKSMVTLWAILGAPFYLGDDLTELSEARKGLLKNPEVLAIQRLAGQNQGRLEGFNSTRLGIDRLRKSEKEVKVECERWNEKRRMVVELSLHDTSSTNLTQCLKAATRLNLQQLQTSLPFHPDTPPSQDEWSLQVWTLEHENGQIFLAIVNAGWQEWFDTPVEMEISLSQLELFRGGRKARRGGGEEWYTVRDVWARRDMGVVSMEAKLKVRLEVHASLLLSFLPALAP